MKLNCLITIILSIFLSGCGDGASSKKSVSDQVMLQAGSLEAKSTGKPDEDKLIRRAQAVTTKYKLTKLSLDCLKFEMLDELYEGKVMIDVREVHNSKCGGDPAVSPRLFSIGIDNKTGAIWSDAKSLVGQLEKLEP